MESRYGLTRFRDFTHAQLVEMLAAGRRPDITAAAGGWRDVANLLDDVAFVLQRRGAEFQGHWEGPAATAHATMLAALVDGVRQVAWAARRTGDQLSAAAEALGRAQERMAALGPPVDLRPPDQAVAAAASTPLPYGQARVEAAARQAAAFKAIQDFRRAQAGVSAAVGAAAAIMEELGTAYLNVELPLPPAVAEPPTVAADGTPVFPPDPAPAANAPAPLFTDLWRNGLAAAAGMPPAQLLRPYLPTPTMVPAAGTPPPSDVDSRPPLPPVGAGSFPGIGDDRAVGQSSLAPMVAPAVASAAVAGAGVGVAAVPPFLGGFAPPMGGMGGEFGGAGGRAAVAWLVGEVEEFGVSSPVVPGMVD